MNYTGKKIKQIRESKGLLLRQLAAHLQVDTALVSKFEHGRRRISKEQVARIASFLQIDARELHLLWLADRISDDLEDEPQALQALKFVESQFQPKS